MTDNPPKFQATIEDLRQYSILIATPLYGGEAKVNFLTSLLELTRNLATAGFNFNFYFLAGESLIPRGRNDCAHHFMTKTDYTHLLFLDADVGFSTQAVMDLLLVYHNDPDKYGVITAAYPKKTISWEKVYAAAISGKVKNPVDLRNYVADLVFNSIGDSEEIRLDTPLPVRESGTGFMMISRKVLDKFKKKHHNRTYISDMTRTATVDEEIVMYFQAEIDPESRRYLSEDYLFCKLVREMGEQISLLPWIDLTHRGEFTYSGNVQAMAEMGLPLTAAAATKDLYKDK